MVYTITSLVVGAMKWLGKFTFIFFILALFVSGYAISVAEPDINTYNIEAGSSQTVLERNLEGHVVVFYSIDETTQQKINFKIFKITSSSNNETIELIFNTNSSEFGKDFLFTSGTYRFVMGSDITASVVFGIANFDIGTITLAAIIIALFVITLSLFIVFFIPSIILLLKQNPEQNNYPPYYLPTNQQNAVKYNIFDHNLEKSDVIRLIIGFLFFLAFIAEPQGPFFFIAIVIILNVAYNVTEREKTKDRILVLLNHYPHTSIDFLAAQLSKKSSEILKILQIMILDDLQPIQIDLNTSLVKVVGNLIHRKRILTPKPISKQTDYEASPVLEQTIEESPTPDNSIIEEEVITDEPIKSHEKIQETYCTACGIDMKSNLKYCYNCGQRQ